MGSYFMTVRHAFLALLVLAFTLTTQSCATVPAHRATEPPMIVVRNQSNADIASVMLRETSKSPNRAVRYAVLSPIPAGTSQIYVRPKNPPPFPNDVTLDWIDNQDIFHSQAVLIAPELRSATGSLDEALVFEIGPHDSVLAYVEKLSRSGTARTTPPTTLQGEPWLLIELNGVIIQLPAGERLPFIIFQIQEQRATGYSGCNEFFGNYDVKGDALVFGSLGMTRRYCAGPSGDVEQAFLDALSKTRSWHIKDQVLLFLAGDHVLARFRRERQETAPR